jgi:hypothetical protein
MVMKEFTAGERLFAADLNDNFDETQLAENILSGTLDAARIPNLDAAKITSGTLGSARLPAGSIIAVKSAIFEGTQSGSLGSRANYAVTDLSITHALANATNKLIISAVLGAVSNNRPGFGAGLAINDGSGLINIGENVSGVLRTSSAMSNISETSVGNLSLYFVHAPGDTTSRTYTVRVQNLDTSTNILTINRPSDDTSSRSRSRGVSSFIIQEVQA